MFDVSVDVTNFFILWTTSFLVGFLFLFFPLFLYIHIKSKKIKGSLPKLFVLLIFIFIPSVSGILALFTVNEYVYDFNRKAANKLLLRKKDFTEKMINKFTLEEIVVDKQQLPTLDLIFSIPRKGVYNLHILGAASQRKLDERYAWDYEQLVIKEDIYKRNLQKGKNTISVKIQNSKNTTKIHVLDLVFIIEPVIPEEKFSGTEESIVIKYPRRIDLKEGIIYYSPYLLDGCMGSVHGDLSCVENKKLRLLL